MKIIFFLILTLIGASTLTTIDCRFELGKTYSCYVISVSGDDLTKVEAITGEHLTGYNHTNVKGLSGWGDQNPDVKKFERIPKNFESFFPNIEVITWEFGNLTTITADDLEPFPNLKMFGVYGNNIKTIDGDLFRHTRSLWYISFSYNQIQNVGLGLLDGLNALEVVYFNPNPCIKFDAIRSPEEMEQLKQQLEEGCFPLDDETTTKSTISTTTVNSEECSAACEERIVQLEKDFTELEQHYRVTSESIAKLEQYNLFVTERLVELEKRIRELGSQPW